MTTFVAAQIDEGSSIGSGVQQDSIPKVKPSDPGSALLSQLSLGSDTFLPWDSSFIMVHRYNRLLRRSQPFVDLGTTASPHKILLSSQAVKPGFQVGLNPYARYNKTMDSVKFYKAAVPLSRFYYTQGGNGVFVFDALHTQNFAPNWNVMVDVHTVQNGEVYSRSNQDHLHRATTLGSRFFSRNGKYSQYLILTWNRARRTENRGIGVSKEQDTLFFVPNAEVIRKSGKYFSESSTASSFYAQRHHKLEQQLAVKENDKLYLFHALDWLKDKYEYTESSTNFNTLDSNFYGNNFRYKSANFKDSTVWIQINNSFGFGSKRNLFHWPILWKLWYSNDRIAYNSAYKIAANIYTNQSVHFNSQLNEFIKGIHTEILADYYFEGWNSGDYHLSLNSKTIRQNNFHISGKLQSQKYRPAFISEKFSSNYILYNTTRNQILHNAFQVTGSFRSSHITGGLNLSIGNYQNYLFTNKSGQFLQLNQLNYTQVEGYLKVRIGKLYVDNRFTIQQNSANSEVPVPAITDMLGLYFQGKIFKNAMLARMGIDIWYMSSYNGYQYNPMNAVFYPSATKAGNYPWVDLYLSGEVKTLMFFIKTEHVNENLMNLGFNNQYFSAIGYPGEAFRLRFGLVWRFYN